MSMTSNDTHGVPPVIILADNGSRRAAATRQLRRIAADLGERLGRAVHPVSLQHADTIDPAELDGEPAAVFPAFLREQLAQGRRQYLVLPLFFGESRALTAFIPEQVGLLREEFGDFSLTVAPPLAPMPQGEPLLADILARHVDQCSAQAGAQPQRVVVVDHGSPLPQVTAVRATLTMALRERLDPAIALGQAVMERRQGAEYDFNGQLLGDLLDSAAGSDGDGLVVLAMMFILPGRHAGEGGDVADICAAAMARNPGLQVQISPLVGEHPLLLDILEQRLASVTALAA